MGPSPRFGRWLSRGPGRSIRPDRTRNKDRRGAPAHWVDRSAASGHCGDEISTQKVQLLATPVSRSPQNQPAVATTAHTRHYDQDNGGVKFFDTFIAVGQREPVICCWQETDLAAEDRAALRSLLTALNTLGRAESWCEAALLADLPQIKFNSQPYQPGQSLAQKETMKLLLPDPMRSGIYETLITETSTMRKAKMLSCAIDQPACSWQSRASWRAAGRPPPRCCGLPCCGGAPSCWGSRCGLPG